MNDHAQACADLNRALFDALLGTLNAMDPLFRPHASWVMNPAWLQVVKKMADQRGKPYWEERATYLFGLPFVVTDDGGAPHLVVIP